MRKRMIILTACCVAALTVLTACAAGRSSDTAASYDTEETVIEEEETIQEEETIKEAEISPNDQNLSGEYTSAEDVQSDPIKIWGTVVDVEDGMIMVENESDVSFSGEILLMIDPENTYVLDAVSGLPVQTDEVEAGRFEAYLGPAMTLSLPPQSTPYAVIVNIPEDLDAPQYVVSKGAVSETGEGRILTSTDGSVYILSEDAAIQPYLTKNVVVIEDIKEGSKCLLWADENGIIERIVLLAP